MKPILGIDTETTGVGENDTVVQVAAVLLDPHTLATLETECAYINPQREIHPKAQEVHGITPEMLTGAPTLADWFQTAKLSDWVSNAEVLFGHNVGFDVRMLGRERFEHLQLLDTYRLVQALYPNWNRHKLESAVFYLALPPRKAHDALGDVLSSADIIRYHRQRGLDISNQIRMSKNLKSETKSKVLGLRR